MTMGKYEITIIRLASDYSMEEVKDIVFEATDELYSQGMRLMRYFDKDPDRNRFHSAVRRSNSYRPEQDRGFVVFDVSTPLSYNNPNELTQENPNSMIIFRYMGNEETWDDDNAPGEVP